MGVAALLIGTSVVTTGAEVYEKERADESRQRALTIRMKQEEAAGRQASINSMENVNHILARQNVVAAAQGRFGSASFNAIQQGTLEKYMENENADALSNSFAKSAELVQQQEIKQDEEFAPFEGALNVAATAANVMGTWNFNKPQIPTAATTTPPVSSDTSGLPPWLPQYT